MKYMSKTIEYIKKSFWILFPIALFPAALLGIFSRPFAFITFLPEYAATKVNGYADVAGLIFKLPAITAVYPVFLIFVAVTITTALSLSVIEKHFRTGKLMLKAPVHDVNSSFFPALKAVAVISAIYLFIKFLFSGLITLFHFIFSGTGTPTPLNVVVTAVVISGLFLLLVYIAVPAVLWAPLMLTFGYSFVDSVIASATYASKATFQLYTALALPCTAITLLQCVIELLPLPPAARMAAGAVLYLFIIVYAVSLMMVAAFELTGLERRDIKRKYS